MVLLVRGAQAPQDLHRVLDRGLAHADGLEAALQRRVLLDRAVLLQRRGADQVQVAARETRLEDVARIHAALSGAAGTDDGVHLVDEEDQLALEGGDLSHRLGEALLEVAAVAGSGEHRGQVQRDDALADQLLRHVAGHDGRCQAFDDGGLADAGLTHQHGVVLRAAAEDLDRLLDLLAAPDDGVELARRGARGQVGAELVEVRRLALPCRLGSGLGAAPGGHRLPHALREGLGGDAGLGEDLPRGRILRQHEGEEEVLGVDVGGAGRAGDLERVEQRALDGGRDDRAFHSGGGGCGGQPLLGRTGDRGGVGADAGHGLAHGGVVHQDAQHVQCVELTLAALQGEAAGLLKQRLRARAQEPAEVDRTLGAGALTGEIPRQELVERVRAVAGVGGEVFGHSRLL